MVCITRLVLGDWGNPLQWSVLPGWSKGTGGIPYTRLYYQAGQKGLGESPTMVCITRLVIGDWGNPIHIAVVLGW